MHVIHVEYVTLIENRSDGREGVGGCSPGARGQLWGMGKMM